MIIRRATFIIGARKSTRWIQAAQASSRHSRSCSIYSDALASRSRSTACAGQDPRRCYRVTLSESAPSRIRPRPLSRRGDRVWLYVHESVPGASVDAFLPKELYFAWAGLERRGRVARYSLPVNTLEKWTRRARRSLSS